ncbi:hypothetical protein [Desulfohalovibrio reitneri]|uniref:hypothetical protein n=1 Tax=Desulfohalovibrio reitneri TaxID=1307759 RepID=UPI0004A786E4|nr:hypothetical protein [Desulfohalovibrio reitneri]
MAALERVCGRSIKEAVTRHLFIDQAYVLTTSSVAVYYPPTEAAALLPLRMDFNTAIRPVYMAGPQTNPVRGTIWLPPYVDATGKGYVTSVCTPVYSGERYVASAGCDLRTRPLGESLLDPSRAALLLLDERRTVVHATPPARRRYGISCLDDVYYLDTVREDVLAPSEYQLDRQSSPTAAALARVLPDDDRRFSFSLLGAPCPAEVRTLENGWRLVGLLPPELP